MLSMGPYTVYSIVLAYRSRAIYSRSLLVSILYEVAYLLIPNS